MPGRGVPGRLDRAITNLLDNAAKWSPRRRPDRGPVRDGEVSVRDHGPGIAESDLPFVFDRFYRAPAARGLPGSGSAWRSCARSPSRTAARCSAERADGGGARMSLKLPVAD